MNQFNQSNFHIVVTGGMGFMGSDFIRYVLDRESFTGTITNIDKLTYAANLKNLEEIEQDPRYFFYKKDVTDKGVLEQVHALRKITHIVHFAAETHVDRSIEDPAPFIHTNIIGTVEILEFVRKNPSIRLHHISTDEVYGSLSKEEVSFENSTYYPNSPYSASKASSDHFVRAYSKTYGILATTSHASNNYGPRQHPEKFIPKAIEQLMAHKKVPVYGKGENLREWLFVEDHSRAIWLILCKGIIGEVYNIAGGVEMKNIDLLKMIFGVMKEQSLLKKDFPYIEFVEDRLGHDQRYALDGSKISQLGFKPLWSLKKGLTKTVLSKCFYHEVR